MNQPLKDLFTTIRTGSTEAQNEAIGTLVEILRKNSAVGMENYTYAFLKPNDLLFKQVLTEAEKTEIVREINQLIHSGSDASPGRASLIWVLGSSDSWDGLEYLLTFLQTCDERMTDEECYQAFCSLDTLLSLGDKDQSRLRSLLISYQIRQIVDRHKIRNRVGLADVSTNVIHTIDALGLQGR